MRPDAVASARGGGVRDLAGRDPIGTAGLAGLQESDQDGAGSIGWIIQMVMADYDDDAGKTRVSVTNTLQVYSQMPTGSG